MIDLNVLPVWEHRQIADIGPRDVIEVIDAIVDRARSYRPPRAGAYTDFSDWAKSRHIIASNPAADLEKPERNASQAG